MKRLFKVMKMEFKITAANKAFIIITILGPFLLLAVTILPTLLVRSSSDVKEGTVIGIVGADERLRAGIQKAAVGTPVTLVYSSDEEEMKEALRDNQVQAFVTVPETYLTANALQ